MVGTQKILERMIPSSGEIIPAIGIGTWEQFDVNLNITTRKSLTDVLRVMDDYGSRLIDSSPMYGKAESVVGELTKDTGIADHFFYATKVWTSGEQSGRNQMEASFRKMNRKMIDLMQVHNLVDWQIHLKTITKWKMDGRIRYTGITHYQSSSHHELEKIIKTQSLDFAQFNYSIHNRNAEESLMPLCMDKGVAVIINVPFEKGSLFNKVRNKSLPSWAGEFGITSWSQYFLKFILSHPAVTCVIPGSSDPTHMEDNLKAGIGKLPDQNGRDEMIEYLKNI